MVVLFMVIWTWLFFVTRSMGLISFQPGVLSGDPSNYVDLATSLLQKGMYSLDGVTPFFEREPGYSLFLAVIYSIAGIHNHTAVFIVQAILHIVACLLLLQAVMPFTGRRASLLALGFLLFSPPVFHVLFALTRESYSLSLAMLLTVSLLHVQTSGHLRFAAYAGVLLGLLILSYSPFLLFPFFAIAVLLLWRVSWKSILLMTLLAGAVVAPWGIRNRQHTDMLCLTGCYRAALQWYVRGEQAQHIRGIEPIKCFWAEYVSRDWTNRSPYCSFNGVWHAKWPDGFKGVPEDAIIAKEGQRKILQYFSHYLWFSLFEIIELHLPYVNGWGRPYNLSAVAVTMLMYIGCVVGAFQVKKKEYLLFVALAGYTIGIFILTDATPRYLLPVIFCYALLSGIGYNWLLSHKWRM